MKNYIIIVGVTAFSIRHVETRRSPQEFCKYRGWTYVKHLEIPADTSVDTTLYFEPAFELLRVAQ